MTDAQPIRLLHDDSCQIVETGECDCSERDNMRAIRDDACGRLVHVVHRKAGLYAELSTHDVHDILRAVNGWLKIHPDDVGGFIGFLTAYWGFAQPATSLDGSIQPQGDGR